MKESDVRRFTKTLAVVSILAPASAHPLGVGDIQMHSALNQKLNADIVLVLSGNENIADVKVNLAPPEKFDEVGIPWNYFLSKIDFKAVKQANGTTIIHLSSKEALNEPFLDFLLEVSWPKGNVYREFTVLVDPPSTYRQTVIPVAMQPAVSKANSKERFTTRPSLVKTRNSTGSTSPINSVYSNGVYGPVNRYDTLWSIAQKVKPDADITDRQMMMALYEANPKAFFKNNVNALSAGYTLKVPKRDVILRMSREQASTEFAQHYDAWKSGVAIASVKPNINSKGTAAKDNNQLKLVAPTKDEISNKVIATAGQTEAVGTGSVAESKDIAELNAINQELDAKMDGLEQQLIKMQKMIELKDAQLVALQGQKDIVLKQQDIKSPNATENIAEAEAKINEQPAATTPAAKVKPPVEKVKPAPVEQQIPESDSDSGVSSYYVTIGGVGVGVLAILGFLWWKRRNQEVRVDTDSMFAGSSEITMPDMEEGLSIPGIEASSTYDVGTVGESSFLSEFTPSDFESFEMDQSEVDPISEADVYLAYGRYKQAEELMLQAIEDQPGRDECKLKLLEIYYANENKDAFENYAKTLAEAGKNKDQGFWGKVTEMGGEINPDSELFKGMEDVQEEANFEAALESDTDQDIGDGAESVTTEVAPDSGAGDLETSLDSEVDLNNEELSAFSNIAEKDSSDFLEANEQLNPEADTLDDGIDFDLNLDSGLNSGDEEPASFQIDEELTEQGSEAPEIESVDFDLTSDNKIDKGLNSEEESLESFDFSDESILDEGNLGTKSDEDSSLSLDEDQDGSADLTEMDELETKIDLAKAYIDMGDDDAAKDIAKEVMDKGNDDQKQSAEEVLSKLK